MTKAVTGLLDYLAKAGAHLPEETIHIEAWDRDVTLRGMTSKLRDAFEEENLRRANVKAANGAGKRSASPSVDLRNFRARLVAQHIVENGMLTFANPRGEEILGEQPAAVLDRLFAVAQRLSGFTQADIEELAKNSEVTAGESFSSDSPDTSAAPLLS